MVAEGRAGGRAAVTSLNDVVGGARRGVSATVNSTLLKAAARWVACGRAPAGQCVCVCVCVCRAPV